MIYIDTSAFLRGMLAGAADHAAAAKLLTDSYQLVSSELLWLEAHRVAIRLAAEDPSFVGLSSEMANALKTINRVLIDSAIINAARSIPQVIKSLDAIHVATVESLGDAIDRVVTYDKTMTSVLSERGWTVSMASNF